MNAPQQPSSFDPSKWKDEFVQLLNQNNILKRQYPTLDVEEKEALSFIEELLIKIMSSVMEKNPHSLQDLERIINSTLPQPINDYANRKARNVLDECMESSHHDLSLIQNSKVNKIVNLVASSSSISSNHQPNLNLSKCSLVMCPIIKQIQLNCKLDLQTAVYLAALLEYIADDIFKLVCKYVENQGIQGIKSQDVKIALNADSLLMDLFFGNNYAADSEELPFSLIDELSMLELDEPGDETAGGPDETHGSFHNIVKELIKEERLFLRELNLIIKVFQEPFMRLLTTSSSVPNTPTLVPPSSSQSTIGSADSNQTVFSRLSASVQYSNDEPIIKEKDVDLIFSNINDIYLFSISFLSLLEDTIEMDDSIGFCFEEMAESLEFDVFYRFAEDLFGEAKQPHQHLRDLFENQKVVSCLNTSGKSVLLCIKYVLPKLLNSILVHCIHYFEYNKLLMNKTPNTDERESLRQSEGLLNPLKGFLEKIIVGKNFKINEGYLKLTRTYRERQFRNAKSKLDEMRTKIDGFNSLQYNQMCNEFIYEGVLSKVRKGDKKGLKHIGENKSERYCFLFDGLLVCCKILANAGNANNFEFKKKEIYFIRNIEVCDSDTDAKSFELVHNIKDHEQKETLIFFAKSKDEKDIWISNLLLLSQRPILERTLDSILSEEKRRIQLRLPDPAAYRFAEKDSPLNIVFDSSTGKDLIKAATLTKLIERLTYHQFADPAFLKIFLLTYRSFCTPETLLDLLIERFNIPFDDELGTQNESARLSREELKRFKKEYLEPIQLRVLNVMKHWVESHYYDLDDEMRAKLKAFLESQENKQRKNLKKWVVSLKAKLEKKEESSEEKKRKYLCENLPPVLHLYEKDRNQFNILTIHPIEFSRQLTLYEFDLYCAVNPCELISAKLTKPDKQLHSPNLSKLIQHNSRFTYWLEKEIVECPNLEERIAIFSRLIDMLQVLTELNNFNGLFEIISAFDRASVYRLDATFSGLPNRSFKIYSDIRELMGGHFQRYKELLGQINPPCVPFFGMYLTQILYLEDGNPDYIDADKQLINFGKRRKIAEITSEIQQYQNQPYCLQLYPELRDFIENLDPLGNLSQKEFDDYVYKKSLEIEPRNCKQPQKGERRYRDINLKSPGIKTSHNTMTSSFAKEFLSNHHHQASTSSTAAAAQSCSSNPQTPNHTTSSPTSTAFFPANKSPPAVPAPVDVEKTVFAPVYIGGGSSASRLNSISSRNSLYLDNHSNLVPFRPVLNIPGNRPPPIPPRHHRPSFSTDHHQRTNSESSTASTASPNVLSSHSVVNTPLIANPSTVGSPLVFNFNTQQTLQPPPLPPRQSQSRTPSQLSSFPAVYSAQPSPGLAHPSFSPADFSMPTGDALANSLPPPLPPKTLKPKPARNFEKPGNLNINENLI